MELEVARVLAKGFIVIGMIGPGIGEGILFAAALQAMGRNPEVSGTIFTRAIVGMAMTESVAIYSLVMFFLI